MRVGALLLVLSLSTSGFGQSRPDPLNVRGPAIGDDGRTVIFAAKVRDDARADDATNLYWWTRSAATARIRRVTNYISSDPFGGVATVTYPGSGELMAYTTIGTGTPPREEVHVFNLTTQVDRTVAIDTGECVLPACVDCFRACLRSAHMTTDGSKVLYEASRDQPFYVVNSDGSGSTRLLVHEGTLAPSPQRVISQGGLVVFTSSAPSGPTAGPLVAAPQDVYAMNLDGTNVRKVTNFGTDARFIARDAVIARNGSRIVFATNYTPQGPASTFSIWMIGPDGSNLVRLSTGTEASSPSISADGSVVTYIQDGQVKRAAVTGNSAVTTAVTKFVTSSPSSAVVGDDGAQVAFALGPPPPSNPGAVYLALTAQQSDLRQLTPVYTPRLLFENGVVSAAGYGKPSPGSLFSAYGANLGFDELAQAESLPLPAQLKEVELLVNSQPVPIHATTPWQINAQLPQGVLPGSPQFRIRYSDTTFTNSVNSTVVATAPENFAVPIGSQQAAALHGASADLVTQANPAVANEVIAIYLVGLGTTFPPVTPGAASPADPPAESNAKPVLRIGGRDAQVLFAGLTPGFAGLYQVNARVPSGLAPGYYALTWTGSDGSTYNSSGIYVK